MNVKEYQEIINQTAVYPKQVGIGYTILGLIGESEELSNAAGEMLLLRDPLTKEEYRPIAKEVGDVLWYIAATCNELSINIEEVFYGDHPLRMTYENGLNRVNEPMLLAASLAEKAKKYLRDGTVNADDFKSTLHTIYLAAKEVGEYFGYPIEEIMEINYNKLIKRRETGTLHGSGDNREEA